MSKNFSIKKEEFMFTIGFHGETAIIDKQAKKEYGQADLDQLLEKGLFKPAFCGAVYEDDENTMKRILDAYNVRHGAQYTSVDQLKRLFGVFSVPENVKKVRAL